MITVLFLILSDADASIDKGILRLAASIIGSVLGILAVSLLAGSPFFFYLFIFLLNVFAIIGYHRSRYPYVWLLGYITIFMICTYSLISPERMYYLAGWRCFEVSLGVIIFVLITSILFPVSFDDKAQSYLTRFYQTAHNILKSSQASPTAENIKTALIHLEQDFNQLTRAFNQVTGSFRSNKKRLFYWRSQMRIARLIYDPLRFIIEGAYLLKEDATFIPKKKYANMVTQLIELLAKISQCMRQNDYQGLELKSFYQVLDKLKANTQRLRQAGISYQASDEALKETFLLLNALDDLSEQLGAMLELLKNKHTLSVPAFYFSNNFDEMKKIAWKKGIKIGIANILALYFWLHTGWYGGASGLITTIIILAQDNTEYSQKKAWHRIGGCLIGAILGLSIVNFATASLFCMLLTISVCSWFIIYFQLHKKYDYVALQAGFAFFLFILNTDTTIMTSIVPGLERVSGIFIGIVIALIVNRLIFPIHIDTHMTLLIQEAQENLYQWFKHIRMNNHEQTDCLYYHAFAEQNFMKVKGLEGQCDAIWFTQMNACHAELIVCLIGFEKHHHAFECLAQYAWFKLPSYFPMLLAVFKSIKTRAVDFSLQRQAEVLAKNIQNELQVLRAQHHLRQLSLKELSAVMVCYQEYYRFAATLLKMTQVMLAYCGEPLKIKEKAIY